MWMTSFFDLFQNQSIIYIIYYYSLFSFEYERWLGKGVSNDRESPVDVGVRQENKAWQFIYIIDVIDICQNKGEYHYEIVHV